MKNIRIFLMDMGIDPALRGFDYLECAVRLVLNDKSYIHSMTRRLYPAVAKNAGITASKAERCMRTAIEKAYSEYPNNAEKLHIGSRLKSGTVTVSTFIAACVEVLQSECEASA